MRLPDFRDHTPDEEPETRALARELEALRFTPRASLESEIRGRVRRGEHLKGDARVRLPWRLLLAAAGAITIAVVAPSRRLLLPSAPAVVDRCCSDLDGGGLADDGVQVRPGRRNGVEELVVYEDRDGSGGLSTDDPVRFRQRPRRVMPEPAPADSGLVMRHACCHDLDGGGADDDGVMVVAAPGDRVVMAAVYERPESSPNRSSPR